MVRLISRQRGGLAALKLTKLFGIDDFPAAKDSGKVLIIIIYCYLIIMISISVSVSVNVSVSVSVSANLHANKLLLHVFVLELRAERDFNVVMSCQ